MKQRYIKQYQEHKGIKLNAANIERNEGLRSLSKIMLNSMWGKMGQNPNKSKTTYVSDCREYVELLTDDMDTLKELVTTDEDTGPVISNPHKIVRKNGELFTHSEYKAYRIVYDKRIISNDFTTFPFGWV